MFAVGTVLHLIDGCKNIGDAFLQTNVTAVQQYLHDTLSKGLHVEAAEWDPGATLSWDVLLPFFKALKPCIQTNGTESVARKQPPPAETRNEVLQTEIRNDDLQNPPAETRNKVLQTEIRNDDHSRLGG